MPDGPIIINSLSPDNVSPRGGVEFSIPPDSITMTPTPDSPEMSIPPGTPMTCVQSKLTGNEGDILISRCECLDSQNFELYQFYVPYDTSPGEYNFSAVFMAIVGKDVIRYEFECPLPLEVTASSDDDPCRITRANPKVFDPENVRTSQITYFGLGLMQLNTSTIKVVAQETGTIFGTVVTGLTDERMQVRLRSGGSEIMPSGSYQLRAQKSADVMAKNPVPVQISPSATFRVFDD